MAYTIKSGDRLGSLAKQYNTTVDQLMALNPQITNPNKIYAGQSLNLPGQVQAGPEPIEVVDSAGGAAAAAAGRTTRQSPEDLAAFNAALAASMNSGGGGIGGGTPSLGVYDEAINNYNNAVAGLRDYYTKYQADQNEQIAQAYENARRQAYVNSRLDAIGNNEVLASMGLSGNLYTSPQSGYTETARIAENLQMRNAIADANTQEKADVNALAIEMMKQNANLDMETAQYLAQLKIDQAKFQEQIRQANIANQMAAAQMALAQQNADRDFAFQQQQFEYQQQQDALAYQLAQQQAAAKSSSSRSSSSSKTTAPVSFGGLVDDDPYYLPTANTYYTPNTVTTPTAVPAASGNTANAQAVIGQITRGVSSAMSGKALKNNVTATVGNRYNSGSLTSAEANYILDFFGV